MRERDLAKSLKKRSKSLRKNALQVVLSSLEIEPQKFTLDSQMFSQDSQKRLSGTISQQHNLPHELPAPANGTASSLVGKPMPPVKLESLVPGPLRCAIPRSHQSMRARTSVQITSSKTILKLIPLKNQAHATNQTRNSRVSGAFSSVSQYLCKPYIV